MAISIILLAIIIAFIILTFIFVTAINNTTESNTTDVHVDWSVYDDEELQSYLPDKKINAIKRYRDLTGLGLKAAKEAIEYMIAHPDAKKGKRSLAADTGGAGIRDLILDGQIDAAVDIYAAFMGVDEFTARDAVQRMQRELEAEANLSEDNLDDLRQLVAEGRDVEAIRQYVQQTGASLHEAKTFIETDL